MSRSDHTDGTARMEMIGQEGEAVGDDASGRNGDDLYLKVAIAVLVLLGVNLALGWVFQYYFSDSLITQVSFTGPDPAALPAGVHFGPALGNHYFGDFEQQLGYAVGHASPYSSANGMVASFYAPAAIVFVKILYAIFGWPGSVFVYLSVSLLALLWGLARLLGPSLSGRLLAVLLLFSAGVLVCLDRGNLQLLVAALLAGFAIGLLEDRPWLMIVAFACAVAIKFYAVVLILLLIRQKRWRDTGLAVGLTAALYAVGFAFFSGGYLANVKGFVRADAAYGARGGTASFGRDFVLGRVSAAAAVYKPLYLYTGLSRFNSIVNHNPGWFIQLPGLVIACVGLLIIWWAKSPLEYGLIAALAMIQLVPASTDPYLEMNMLIELCLLLRILSRPSRDDESTVARPILILCVGLLVIGSAPWFGLIYGRSVPALSLSQILSPWANIGVMLALTIGLAQSRRRMRAPTSRSKTFLTGRLTATGRSTRSTLPTPTDQRISQG